MGLGAVGTSVEATASLAAFASSGLPEAKRSRLAHLHLDTSPRRSRGDQMRQAVSDPLVRAGGTATRSTQEKTQRSTLAKIGELREAMLRAGSWADPTSVSKPPPQPGPEPRPQLSRDASVQSAQFMPIDHAELAVTASRSATRGESEKQLARARRVVQEQATVRREPPSEAKSPNQPREESESPRPPIARTPSPERGSSSCTGTSSSPVRSPHLSIRPDREQKSDARDTLASTGETVELSSAVTAFTSQQRAVRSRSPRRNHPDRGFSTRRTASSSAHLHSDPQRRKSRSPCALSDTRAAVPPSATQRMSTLDSVADSFAGNGTESSGGTVTVNNRSPDSTVSSNDNARSHIDSAAVFAHEFSVFKLHQHEVKLELEQQRASMAAEHHRQLMLAQKQQRAVEEELAAREIQSLHTQLEEQRIAAQAQARAQAQSLQTSAEVERDARQLLVGLRAEKDTQWQSKYEELARMYTVAATERDTALAERDCLARQLEDAHTREESTRCVLGSMMSRRVNTRLLELTMQSLWSTVVSARRLRRAAVRRSSWRKSVCFWGWYRATQQSRLAFNLQRRSERHFLRVQWHAWITRSRRETVKRHDEDWHVRMTALHENMVGHLVRRRHCEAVTACFLSWRRKSTLTWLLQRHLARTQAAMISRVIHEWLEQARRWKHRKLVSMQCMWMPTARVLQRWREAVATQKLLRHTGGLIADGRVRRALTNNLKAWAHVTMLRRRRRRKCDAAMCRVYKLNLRRQFLSWVVSSHTRRRLRSILVRAEARRNQRSRAIILEAWAHVAASRARSPRHRHWNSRKRYDLDFAAGEMFEGGEVAVVAKALAQKARIEVLAESIHGMSSILVPKPVSGTMDRLEEERHARIAILQSEHRIILDQLRAGHSAGR